MADTDLEKDVQTSSENGSTSQDKDFVEFEIGQHKVPWFLWLFFALIITWASVSWIKFFGY